MKKLLIAAMLISLNAAASEPVWKKIYLRADGMYGFPLKVNKNVKLNNAPGYGGGVGFRFNEFFRSDIDLQFRNNKTSGEQLYKKIDSRTLWCNTAINLTDFSEMTPYLTFGVGISANESKRYSNPNFADGILSVTTSDKKVNRFAWNVGAGTTYKLSNLLHVDFSYKFVNLGKFEANGFTVNNLTSDRLEFKSKGTLKSHELLAGVIIHIN
ncbi:MAG: porin family protein [Rickettsiales bacterium]|nr:porin family protein [Rickettsiales bacterium]